MGMELFDWLSESLEFDQNWCTAVDCGGLGRTVHGPTSVRRAPEKIYNTCWNVENRHSQGQPDEKSDYVRVDLILFSQLGGVRVALI